MSSHPTVHLPARTRSQHATWGLLLKMADEVRDGWVVIGGQMVALHAAEHGVELPRITEDADIIANVRAEQGLTVRMARWLKDHGLEMEGPSPEGIGHRFSQTDASGSRIVVDLLAPEGLGPRTNIKTVGQARTLEVPGGSQLLDRGELINLHVTLPGREDVSGLIRRPSLLAAIIGKAAASEIAIRDHARDLGDLAFLLSLVDDPLEMRAELTPKDRSRLQRHAGLREDPGHAVYGQLPTDRARLARQALAVLVAVAS